MRSQLDTDQNINSNNKQNDIVCIPQRDIDRLETARLYLHKLLKDNSIMLDITNNVTNIMWEITHRKYPWALK